MGHISAESFCQIAHGKGWLYPNHIATVPRFVCACDWGLDENIVCLSSYEFSEDDFTIEAFKADCKKCLTLLDIAFEMRAERLQKIAYEQMNKEYEDAKKSSGKLSNQASNDKPKQD